MHSATRRLHIKVCSVRSTHATFGRRLIRLTLRGTALLLSALLVASCTRPSGPPTVEVHAVTLQPAPFHATVALVGVLVPTVSVDLASQVAGRVKTLPVDVGSRVKAGDLLFELETDTLHAQLNQAQAALAATRAQAELARNQKAVAKIELDAAQKDYDDSKTLFDTGAASHNQLDQATDRLNTARRRYASATGPALDQVDAAVRQAQASIQTLRVQIDDATIKSPIDGVVTNMTARLGALVTPGAPVISVSDTSVLKLRSTIPQEVLPLLSLGQAARVTVDIFPGKPFPGRITTLGPIAVSTGEVFPIEVSIPNDGTVMAGVSAHASIEVSGKPGLVVPPEAVLEGNGEHYVFVIAGGVAHRRVVTPGLRTPDGIEILGGLAAGEAVAETNVNALGEGTPVRMR